MFIQRIRWALWLVAMTFCLADVASAVGSPQNCGTFPTCGGSCDQGFVCEAIGGPGEAVDGKLGTQGGGASEANECLCLPLGACCQPDGGCSEETDRQCPGLFFESTCGLAECPIPGDEVYTPLSCSDEFEDISGSGTALLFSDDDGVPVGMPFNFIFYGDSHGTVGISSNGYLSFGALLASFANTPIPNTQLPNDLIAPLWNDLNPGAGGTVHYQALGMSPNARFIVQWTDVPEFFNSGANTFQAVLFEGTNVIQFRYGAFTDDDYTAGVENQTGTRGTNIDPATIAPGDCIQFVVRGADFGEAAPVVSSMNLALMSLALLCIGAVGMLRQRAISDPRRV